MNTHKNGWWANSWATFRRCARADAFGAMLVSGTPRRVTEALISSTAAIKA